MQYSTCGRIYAFYSKRKCIFVNIQRGVGCIFRTHWKLGGKAGYLHSIITIIRSLKTYIRVIDCPAVWYTVKNKSLMAMGTPRMNWIKYWCRQTAQEAIHQKDSATWVVYMFVQWPFAVAQSIDWHTSWRHVHGATGGRDIVAPPIIVTQNYNIVFDWCQLWLVFGYTRTGTWYIAYDLVLSATNRWTVPSTRVLGTRYSSQRCIAGIDF